MLLRRVTVAEAVTTRMLRSGRWTAAILSRSTSRMARDAMVRCREKAQQATRCAHEYYLRIERTRCVTLMQAGVPQIGRAALRPHGPAAARPCQRSAYCFSVSCTSSM
jgi:hypothetical protein